MFFFFVGGVEQHARQVLKSGVAACIRCGSKADLVEYEKVLKLFFVPVWRWPGKEPALYCRNCDLFYPRSFSLPPPPKTEGSQPPPSLSLLSRETLRCRFCDRVVEPEFRFCPFCGSSL